MVRERESPLPSPALRRTKIKVTNIAIITNSSLKYKYA